MKKIVKKTKINGKKKNKHGITLIALVVTIVVLLILAGITINLLFSNGGIFDIANQAKMEHEIGALKDRINNVIADWSIERALDPTVTVDDLWDKMVDADIIDNPDEDVAGPEKEGENDIYQVTTNEGYVVEVIVSPDGNVSIGDVVKGDSLPPKIGEITSTSGSNSIHIEVEITRSEGEVSLSYYYKKDGEPDSSYVASKEGVKDLTADFTGLEQQKVYNIKVVVEDENGTAEKVINVTTGELTGAVNQKGETVWSNGTATIELETTETGVTIQYQVGGTEGQWLDYKGPITGLNHGQTVYALITDGINQSGYTSIDILDQINPQNAQIELSGNTTNTTGSIIATVTHIDNETGVDIGNCKWEYNTNSNPIGTEASNYTNSFSNDGEKITLSASTVGTYYLHVLTVDKAGNKLESISHAITVTQLVTGITITPTSLTLEEGQTQQLTASITPDNASNKAVSWSSNNTNIATVSSTGLVTAKTEGTATITVKANDGSNMQATCTVTIKKPLLVENTLKEGNYVQYVDGTGVTRKCIVLYGPENSNYSSYGVQIITKDTVEDVELGNGTGSEQYKDETYFNTAINSYNTAIIYILNKKAEIYLNTTYANDARGVGSVPNNKNSQANEYQYISFSQKYSGSFLKADSNYLTDYEQMKKLGIASSDKNYWLASRHVTSHNEDVYFDIYYMGTAGNLTNENLCYIYDTGTFSSNSFTHGLRPIFTLKPGIKVTGGSGTSDDPYTLGI